MAAREGQLDEISQAISVRASLCTNSRTPSEPNGNLMLLQRHKREPKSLRSRATVPE
jgi:hypothetical protein